MFGTKFISFVRSFCYTISKQIQNYPQIIVNNQELEHELVENERDETLNMYLHKNKYLII